MAVDASGIVYVADSSNQRIQKIAGGMVTTLAGSGVSGAMDGTAAAAQFFTPAAVAVGPDGTVYVADLNNQTVRKIAADGVVTTLAGSPRISGTVDGVGAAARFNRPVAIAVDGNGIVYVAEESGTGLRRIAPDGTVTTLAGTAGMVGSTDGNGAAARFGALAGLAVDGAGDVWVADADSHAVRKVTSAGAVTTVAGKPTDHGSNDGSIAEARFHFPVGIAVDDAGNLYVADAGNATVRKISAGGTVTTLAGSPGMTGTVDDTGPAARFRLPVDVAVDSDGNLYVADESDATIRKVAPGGVVTTLAGSPGSINGETDGVGANAHFVSPRGVAIDDSRALYITDISTNTIRKLTPFGAVGSVSTVAGAATAGNTDGLAAMARFNAPVGVAVDGAGNLYISDLDNATIRKMSAAGLVTTLAGSAGHAGYADGLGATARFATPTGIAVDDAGNVYVADGQNSVIRKVTPDGKVTTVAGKAGVAQVVLGQDPGLAFPCCVAIAGDSLLIVDQGAILRLHPR